MPPLTAFRLPLLRDDNLFEQFCRDLWAHLWDDPSTERHGRSGQRQRGVDVFGRPDKGAQYAGVQCKAIAEPLTEAQLRHEVEQARSFTPPLVDLVIATTAPKDVHAEARARALSQEHAGHGLFSVTLLGWDDILERLRVYPDLIETYFQVETQGSAVAATVSAPESPLMTALHELLRRTAAVRGQEQEYLRELIADLEPKGGADLFIDLAAQAEIEPETDPPPSVSEMWGLGPEFAQTQTALLQNAARAGAPPPPTVRPASKPRQRFESVLEAARLHPRFVLVGRPGGGKTTVLHRLVLLAAREFLENPITAPLPLLLHLASWTDDRNAAGFVRDQAERLLSGGEANHVLKALAAGTALLFLDGLNEMGASGLAKVQELQQWLGHGPYRPRHVVIACRAHDYGGSDRDLGLPRVELEELDETRIRQFALRRLAVIRAAAGEPKPAEPLLAQVLPSASSPAEDARHLFRLARNPYLLTLLLYVYVHTPGGVLPRQTGILFRMMVEHLWRRETLRQTPGQVPLEAMLTALSHLAYAMIDKGQPTEMSHAWVLRQVQSATGVGLVDAGAASAFLRAAHGASLLEVNEEPLSAADGGGQVRFYHQRLQEFFVSYALGHRACLPSRLAAREPDTTGLQRMAGQSGIGAPFRSRWDQVILELCTSGVAPDLDGVVRQVLEDGDPFFAAECVEAARNAIDGDEVRAQPVSEVLRQEILQRVVSGAFSSFPDNMHATRAIGQLADPVAVPSLLQALAPPAAEHLPPDPVPSSSAQALDADYYIGALSTIARVNKADSEAIAAVTQALVKCLTDRRITLYGGRVCDRAAGALEGIETPEALAALRQWREQEQNRAPERVAG